MKQFYVTSKVVGLLLAAAGIFLSAWMWTLLYGAPAPFELDLLGPTLWSFPILDWMITGVLFGLGILAVIHTLAEGRTWTNFVYGLPMFAMNMITLHSWWHMELGKGTDVNVAAFLFSFTMLVNTIVAMIFLLRRFSLPEINT